MRQRPTVDGVRTAAYVVPTDGPEADGTLEWSSTGVVVVRVSCGPNEGLGWTYAPAAAASVIDETLAGHVLGSDPMAIIATQSAMTRACRNLGLPGIAACAISAVDVALWDLKAKLMDLPLTDLFGRISATVPIYGSGGFTNYTDPQTYEQVRTWVDQMHLSCVKIKVGESAGRFEARDLHRVSLVRNTIGPEAELFVDANGGYSRKQAIRLGRTLAEDFAVSWFEEPVSSDDLDGLRMIRDNCQPDIAAGEYGYTPSYFARMIGAGAVDCLQADVTRCGGYTGWLNAARMADAAHLDISAHCAPALHAPVAAAVPNLRHVEYFYDHYRIEEELFDGASSPHGGTLAAQGVQPGHGLSLREDRSAPFLTDHCSSATASPIHSPLRTVRPRSVGA